MVEDGFLETLQGVVRLEAKLLVEQATAGSVDLERVRLTARPVQSEHLQAPQPFAERVLADELVELADELPVPSERELRIDPLLQRLQPELVESGDPLRGERLVREVRERWAAPSPTSR